MMRPYYDFDFHISESQLSKSQPKYHGNIYNHQLYQDTNISSKDYNQTSYLRTCVSREKPNRISRRELLDLQWNWLFRYNKPYFQDLLDTHIFPEPNCPEVNRSVQEKNLQCDPRKKFMPTEYLAILVEKHMIYPDEEEVIDLLREIKKEAGSTADIVRNIEVIITEEVEGLITSLAKHTFITKESTKISKDNRFTPEICKDLTNRLGLDPYDPRPVLDQLYHELFDFVSLIPRERVWGKIVVEDSELKLILKDNAFTFPGFDEIEKDGKWIVT